MLPDFLKLKRVLAEKAATSISNEMVSEPLLTEIAHHHLHEGDRFTMIRQDGSTETKPFESFEARGEMSTEDIRAGDLQVIQRARAEITEQLRGLASRKVLETAELAAKEIGNMVNAGGRPLTAELVLEGFDKMEFSFTPEGDWKPPTIVIHPDMGERARRELERLEKDPELKARMTELLERKREEWLAREANRKLVD